MTDAPPTDAPLPPPTPRPLWRNPWLWAALIGVGTMHLVRPLMRHVPPPPPVSGQLPTLSLTDHLGKPLGPNALAGTVWVAAILPWPCDPICDQQMAAIGKLSQRFKRFKSDARVLLVTGGTDAAAGLHRRAGAKGVATNLTTVAQAAAPDLARLRQTVRLVGSVPAADGGAKPGKSGRPLLIIDRDGGIRGAYPDTEKGIDEVFHRSEHVVYGTL